MTGVAGGRRPRGSSGQGLLEFSLVAVMTVIMLLFIVEMGRMLLVYTTVANAARAGVRYAIVHGSSRATGSAADDASGPGSNPAQVLTVVDDFAGTGLLTPSLLVIHVTYPGGSNAPGQSVNITVVYPYNPLTTYFSKALRLGSASQGVIVY
jgi:Flp pilus assembly protein TadG